MPTFEDVQQFFKEKKFHVIIAADAQPISTKKVRDKLMTQLPAGGVAVALAPAAQASNALYIARGRSEEDKVNVNNKNEVVVTSNNPSTSYTLKRIFLTPEETQEYYLGFSNQTLWPLCHIAFERPEFKKSWFDGYTKVNEYFAKAIQENLQEQTLLWINDYHLSLVPGLLHRSSTGRKSALGFFWHIPWPTWEIFRILPQKHEILESLLTCDYIAFHRGYHVRNFLETLDRELPVRIDRETNRIYYKDMITTVGKLPMGIDTDVITQIVEPEMPDTFLSGILRALLGIEKETPENQQTDIDTFFKENKVILGVDRLDYTKGLTLRLSALDTFFQMYPQYIGHVTYLGILAPSREEIPAYTKVRKDIYTLAKTLNETYQKNTWKPIHLVSGVYERAEILQMYKKAQVCLVTPLDDGMNLVSKEFIVSSSLSKDPGVLVLSRFAGSAIDLTDAIIVNPYDIESVAKSIHEALSLQKEERLTKTQKMAQTLQERNVYGWIMKFCRETLRARQTTE